MALPQLEPRFPDQAGSLNFGSMAVAGNYTVVSNNPSTGCSVTMSGAAVVVDHALPTAFAVTGGGDYCPSGTGVHIGLSGSEAGINYQLYQGTTLIGTAVPGTGGLIDFGLHATLGLICSYWHRYHCYLCE